MPLIDGEVKLSVLRFIIKYFNIIQIEQRRDFNSKNGKKSIISGFTSLRAGSSQIACAHAGFYTVCDFVFKVTRFVTRIWDKGSQPRDRDH